MPTLRRRPLRVERLESRETPSINPVGPEFQVNVLTTANQWQPRVACDAAGDFVIVFPSFDQSLSTHFGLYGQLYHADGTTNGPQFVVSELASYFATDVSVAMAPDGRFVVAWDTIGDINVSDQWTISARQYDATGVAQGVSFKVNQNSTFDCLFPEVAIAASGAFAVSWTMVSNFTTGQANVMARAFGPGGLPVTPELLISPSGHSSIAMAENENVAVLVESTTAHFVVFNSAGTIASQNVGSASAWQYDITYSSSNQFIASVNDVLYRFSSTGSPIGGPSSYSNALSLIAAQQDGTVVSAGPSAAASNADVLVLSCNADNTFNGSPIQFNTYTAGEQSPFLRLKASMIVDSAGQHLDGNGDGITGDDFVMTFHRLLGDFDGNGVVDGLDFGAFRLAFGSTNLQFDLDGDGVVNALDFNVFRSVFGQVV